MDDHEQTTEEQNASPVDAYMDGFEQGIRGTLKALPTHYTDAAMVEWKAGYADGNVAAEGLLE